jgi:hypothetical protein
MSIYEVKLALERPAAFLDGSSSALLQPEAELPAISTEFLERHFQRAPGKEPWVLRITTKEATEEERKKLQAAITNYYSTQVQASHDALKLHWHTTRQMFLYGCIFLGLCLVLQQVFEQVLGESFPRIFSEGLIIIGWVAIWRPAEMLTYNWVPLVRRLKLQRKLSQLSVQLHKN